MEGGEAPQPVAGGWELGAGLWKWLGLRNLGQTLDGGGFLKKLETLTKSWRFLNQLQWCMAKS